MTKAIYLHDHIFKKDSDGNYYSEGKITDKVFCRYLCCADNLLVISRVNNISSIENLEKITSDAATFNPVKGSSFFQIFSIYLFSNLSLFIRSVNKCDLAILRLPSFLGVAIFPFLLISRKPYFVEVVGHAKESLITRKNSGIFTRAFASFFNTIISIVIKKANGVIYVTENYLQSAFPTKGFTGSASDVDLEIEDLNLDSNDYKIKDYPPKIGLIGSYNNNYKGIDTAIKAIAILISQGLKCELRILGSGNSEPYLALAKNLGILEYIKFDGIRSGGKPVYDWLDCIDIYIQPSRTEGLPRSLIEAMSRGLPCISTNAGGMPELLEANWVINVENHQALASKLLLLIHDRPLRKSIGIHNYYKSKNYSSAILDDKRKLFWLRAKQEIK